MSHGEEIAGQIDALDQRLSGVEACDLARAAQWCAARQAALEKLRQLLDRDALEKEEALRLRGRLQEISGRQGALEQRLRLVRAQLREQLARLGRSGHLGRCFASGIHSSGARMSLRG